MPTFIHSVASGSAGNGLSGAPRLAVEGTIIGVATTNVVGMVATDFDNASFVAAGIGFAQIPDDIDVTVGAVLGTPLSAGTGNSAFASEAAFTSGMSYPPYDGLIYNGTEWVKPSGLGFGEPLTLTITTAGEGYATGSDESTRAIDGNGNGLLVDINTVGGSGEITSVSIGSSAGAGYVAGDTLTVLGGDGAAVLTVGSTYEPTLGTLNTGRGGTNQAGPNDMNPSYFTATPYGLDPSELRLYIPSSGQVISYDASLPSPYTFDSFGDCFVGGDFTIEIQYLDGSKIAELTCPGPQTVNSDVDFSLFLPAS